MFRTSILAMIFGFISITVFAEDARQLTCSGTMIEPNAMGYYMASWSYAQLHVLQQAVVATESPDDAPRGNPRRESIFVSGEVPWRNPMIGIAGCCARAASGQAATAPPSGVMNWRRLIIRSPRRPRKCGHS